MTIFLLLVGRGRTHELVAGNCRDPRVAEVGATVVR
jgi:hypothetical protein